MIRLSPLVALLWLVALVPAPVSADQTLNDKIRDSKFRFGDYAFYVSWHDPVDWQFDEHASSAFPVGVKVRWRALDWLQVEGDISYFQRGGGSQGTFTVLPPKLDALMVAATLQWRLPEMGAVRPYLGAGPVFASIGNDFLAFRPDLAALNVNEGLIELYSWSRLDLGWQTQVGVDWPLGKTIPFVEFKYQFGEATFGPEDVKAGLVSLRGLSLEISDLETVPEVESLDTLASDLEKGGRPYEAKYDWSGPIVMVGVKVRF